MAQKSCTRCKVALGPIKLLDATQRYVGGEGGDQVELKYAAADAESSFWTKDVPASGVVRGFMCPTCGRITLYGVPFE